MWQDPLCVSGLLVWGARGPEFKSRRPDQIPQRLTDSRPSPASSLESNWSPKLPLPLPTQPDREDSMKLPPGARLSTRFSSLRSCFEGYRGYRPLAQCHSRRSGHSVESRMGASTDAPSAAPFPIPAHQTGRAQLRHPAFRLASPQTHERGSTQTRRNCTYPSSPNTTSTEAAGAARLHLLTPHSSPCDTA